MKDLNDIRRKGKLCFKICYDRGGGSCFKATVFLDNTDYCLWAESSFFYGLEDITIEDKKVDHIKTQMMMHKVFPLEKWKISPKGVLMLDGPYLMIEYHNMGCDVSISSSTFNSNAAEEIVKDIISLFKLDSRLVN